MKRSLSRRSVLAAGRGIAAAACVAAVPRPLRACNDSAAPPPLSIEGLLAISDDENALMDGLRNTLWRAPYLLDIVRATGASLRVEGTFRGTYDVRGTYGIDRDRPIVFQGIERGTFDQLAILFACEEAANDSQDIASNLVNVQAVAQKLQVAVHSADAQRLSERVYLGLLKGSSPKNSACGTPTLGYYYLSPGWANSLAAALRGDGFITQTLLAAAGDPPRARHNLSMQLYKLRYLDSSLVPTVAQRWQAPDLKDTIFPLAAADPWPPNYVERLSRPLDTIIAAALAIPTYTSQSECHSTGGSSGQSFCHSYNKVTSYGDALKDTLRKWAGPFGVLR
jgi:hypothetical protein